MEAMHVAFTIDQSILALELLDRYVGSHSNAPKKTQV